MAKEEATVTGATEWVTEWDLGWAMEWVQDQVPDNRHRLLRKPNEIPPHTGPSVLDGPVRRALLCLNVPFPFFMRFVMSAADERQDYF